MMKITFIAALSIFWVVVSFGIAKFILAEN